MATNAAPAPQIAPQRPQAFTTFGDFTKNSIPATYADMAKALVWAFIAGFSEGLVPNFISKITKEASEETRPGDVREKDPAD